MKVILAMVESVDGKTTHGDDPKVFHWTSREDQQHFKRLVEQAKLIVMGSKTYEAAKGMLQHQNGKLRVVLTRSPEKYADQVIPGQLEFTNEPPQELMARLEQLGYTELLLASGAQVNGLFFNAGLVDEILLTIEPKLLGKGNPIALQENLIDLTLLKLEKLNDRGTLLLHYKINKSL